MKPGKPVSSEPVAGVKPNTPKAPHLEHNAESWWTGAEVFGSGTVLGSIASPPWTWEPWQNGVFDWATLAQSRVPFITHCPVNKEFIEQCHRLGVRCFPYVSFYFGSVSATFGITDSSTYEGIKWADHIDWYARSTPGSPDPAQWIYGNASDGVGVRFSDPRAVCPNVQGYHDKMKEWVGYVMSQGADGIFIDNLGAGLGECFAPKLIPPIHEHIIPDDLAHPGASQTKAFGKLLHEVRAIVKQHKPDGLMLGNSGNPLGLPPEIQEAIDADMLEAYICGVQGNSLVQYAAMTSQQWDQLGQQLQDYLGQGKQLLVISPLGSARGVREDAFLCYASARLAGFIWLGATIDAVPMSHPQVADLFRIRLGKPLGGEMSQGLLRYRVFERGLVAVNLDGANAASLSIQAAQLPTTHLYDLFPDDANLPNIDATPPGSALQIPAFFGPRLFVRVCDGLRPEPPGLSGCMGFSAASPWFSRSNASGEPKPLVTQNQQLKPDKRQGHHYETHSHCLLFTERKSYDMTPKEKAFVQTSFAELIPVSDAAARFFYNRLFELDPKLRLLFKGDMQEQGRKLMSMLATAVRGLDQVEALVPALQALGRRHAEYGVRQKDYETVGAALITTLQVELGPRFTTETRAAWLAVYNLVASVMQAPPVAAY